LAYDIKEKNLIALKKAKELGPDEMIKEVFSIAECLSFNAKQTKVERTMNKLSIVSIEAKKIWLSVKGFDENEKEFLQCLRDIGKRFHYEEIRLKLGIFYYLMLTLSKEWQKDTPYLTYVN